MHRKQAVGTKRTDHSCEGVRLSLADSLALLIVRRHRLLITPIEIQLPQQLAQGPAELTCSKAEGVSLESRKRTSP